MHVGTDIALSSDVLEFPAPGDEVSSGAPTQSVRGCKDAKS